MGKFENFLTDPITPPSLCYSGIYICLFLHCKSSCSHQVKIISQTTWKQYHTFPQQATQLITMSIYVSLMSIAQIPNRAIVPVTD